MKKPLGNYDLLCEWLRESYKADGVAVIVVNGEPGTGFSVCGTEAFLRKLPDLLRVVAKDMDSQIATDIQAARDIPRN